MDSRFLIGGTLDHIDYAMDTISGNRRDPLKTLKLGEYEIIYRFVSTVDPLSSDEYPYDDRVIVPGIKKGEPYMEDGISWQDVERIPNDLRKRVEEEMKELMKKEKENDPLFGFADLFIWE